LVDGTSFLDLIESYNRFVQGPSGEGLKLVAPEGETNLRSSAFMPSFSPDGRRVVLDGTPLTVPDHWSAYTPPHFQEMLRDRKVNPRSAYGRQFLKLFLVNTDTGVARPLWDAPLNGRGDAAYWSPDGKAVIVGPTFLPTDKAPGKLGLEGLGFAIVDLETREVTTLPTDEATGRLFSRSVWQTPTRVDLELQGGERRSFEKIEGHWIGTQAESVLASPKAVNAASVEVVVRQSMNIPQRLIAIDRRTGEETVAFDPTPSLRSKFSLGFVRSLHWMDPDGSRATGRLYLPVGYKPGLRYPVVLQTHALAQGDEFSLYGPGAMSGYGSIGAGGGLHLAQILASSGIAVLQIGDRFNPATDLSDGPTQAKFFMERYEAAARRLITDGVADPDRIGIIGHSRTGWFVEYALAHSDFRYAAAIASDNMDGSYLQGLSSGWSPSSWETTGGPPFGSGMKLWLENAPAFNADRIQTPLQLQVMGADYGFESPVLMHWEMFAALRGLNKPVELYLAPDFLRGAHALQNPKQLLGLQDRILDWWRFWLLDAEDPAPDTAEQFGAWRELRRLHEADVIKPRPVAREWQVRASAPAAN
jgi:dipeptidyl aminopeptidase/acylaminoacyl peptidase